MRCYMIRKIVIIILTFLIAVSLILTGTTIYEYYFGAPYETGTISEIDMDTEGQEETDQVPPLEATDSDRPYSENAVGWLRVKNAEIDDVVLQADDNEYYLTHNEYDEYNVWGSYFLEANNSTDIKNLDKVTLIFGHSNGNAQYLKFSTLKKFKDIDFAKKTQFIEYWIGDTKTIWQIFAACDYPVAEHTVMNINPNDESFMEQVNRLKELSYNKYTTSVDKDDNLLFLVTCSGDDTYDYRFVVAAKLVKKEA